MYEDLAGRRVLVTGAGSGIGQAIARRFLEVGAIVGANVLPGDEAGLGRIEELGSLGEVHPVFADVSDADQVADAFGEFIDRVGTVEVLASNAGIGQKGDFLELTDADWRRMLDVHVMGAVNSTKACLPGMLEGKFGRVIYTASELAPIGMARLTHYCAAKGALVSLCHALAREVGEHGVTVNCIAPGPTVTPMFVAAPDEYNDEAMQTIPMRTFGDPDNVALSWLFLASDAGRWYTGQFVSPNGGVTM